MNVVDMRAGRHDRPGYFALEDLPQRGTVAKVAFGVGWDEFDKLFKFYPGQFTVITGIAGHGKSTFVQNAVVKLAVDKGIKSFLYVPENEAHLVEKLQLLWPDSNEDFRKFCAVQCFVQSAVPDHYQDAPQTLMWILEQAAAAVRDDGVKIAVIDPWNELDRAKPKDMLLSDYVGECLRLIKQFCRTLEVAVIVVAHPTKAINEHGGKITSLADIEQSMNWYNKADNGLIVVREGNLAKVISAKVREIGAGKPGICYFDVDPETGVFTPLHGAVNAA